MAGENNEVKSDTNEEIGSGSAPLLLQKQERLNQEVLKLSKINERPLKVVVVEERVHILGALTPGHLPVGEAAAVIDTLYRNPPPPTSLKRKKNLSLG